MTVSVSRAWTQPGGRRGFTVGASCGVCGKTSIDQVRLACPVVPRGDPIPASLVSALPDRLRASQRSFELTGGLHAAGLFDRDGALVCAREDIGRHNAVDKVVGHLILQRRAVPDGAVLVVSGRVGFEITQKAAMAGIGVVAAISAPSSLAIQAATRLGVTIAAFVRAGTLTLYTHPERIALPDGQ